MTGAQLQIVRLIPLRYGATSGETQNSWIYCRSQAFAAHAAFGAAARLVKVGDPVVGFVEPTNKGACSAHLVGWDLVDISVWRATAPETLPVRFELNPNASLVNHNVVFD